MPSADIPKNILQKNRQSYLENTLFISIRWKPSQIQPNILILYKNYNNLEVLIYKKNTYDHSKKGNYIKFM